jgi:putative ABC transport system permease protein
MSRGEWWKRMVTRASPGASERNLDDDVRAHLELLAAEHVRRGLTTEEARLAALRDFGGVEPMKEAYRDVRGSRWFEHVTRDLVYAGRALRKSPGFTLAVVLTLALGIGANTAVFTLIDALSWRSLPIRDPESLQLVSRIRLGRTETGFTYPQFQALREAVRGGELAGYSSSAFPVMLTATVTDGVEPPISGQIVSGNYFNLLGVVPQLGRLIGPDDDRVPNAHPVVVLSDGYWRRRFARASSVVGSTLLLSGARFDVIGVTPPEFFGVDVGLAPDVYVPMMMQAAVMPVVGDLLVKPSVNRTWVQLLARIDADVGPSQVAAPLEPVYRESLTRSLAGAPLPSLPNMRARFGYDDKIVFVSAATGISDLRLQFSTSLFILLAIVGAVLLVGCVNIANLLLVRAAARRPEMALRLALGASRWRVMQQVLVEGAVLGAVGGAAGLVLAYWLTRGLIAYASTGRTPIALDISPDARMLAFTVMTSLVCTLLFVCIPALRVVRVDLLAAIKNVNAAGTFARMRPGKLLVVAQVSLSLLLLVAAGLFIRTLANLTRADQDAARDHVLVVRVEPRGSNQRGVPGTSERLDRLYTELMTRLRGVPGVRSASMGNVSPGKPESGAGSAIVVGGGTVRMDDPRSGNRPITASGQAIYPDYFKTLGIGLRGRDFSDADQSANAEPVCIVNEAFVRIAYPNEEPLGKICTTSGVPRRAFTIVGVADDSRYANPRAPVQPVLYTPFLQANTGRGQMILYVRTDGETAAIAARVRDEVWKADSTVPQFEVRTLAEEIDAVVVRERLLATLSTSFGVLGLILTAIGLHGVLSFLVVQRVRELAIRIALGAPRVGVVAMVVREAAVVVSAGALVAVPLGLAITRLSSRWLSELLYGLTPDDGLTLAGASLALVVVGAIAASLPARRASAVDPMVALRAE